MKKIIFLLLTLLVGCNKTDEMSWVASVDIQAFQEVNGMPSFVIKRGESCKKGGHTIGKVDRYLAVVCASGKGLIIDEGALVAQLPK